MLTEHRLNLWLGRILQIGIIISIVLVMLGGVSFLLVHGGESLENNIFVTTNYDIDVIHIWRNHLFTTPIGWIELGLLTLVMAQILRVAVLCYYYVRIKDIWFTSFSFFILSIILYSLIWQ